MLQSNRLRGIMALSPIVVLLGVYLLLSILSGDFYKISISVAFVTASIYSVIVMQLYKRDLKRHIDTFSKGASDSNIIYMIWIFILAGIFASAAQKMGAIDATVDLCLQFIPSRFIPAGIFLAACFISLSIGTSVGTIVALTPVVAKLSADIGADSAQMVAIVVGGAFFGDNLSFISDTTIAATMTQGCRMRDKFRTNLSIVLPAAILSLALYLFLDFDCNPIVETSQAMWYQAIPYMLVIICALCGINVLVVLLLGIISAVIIGGNMDIISLSIAADNGIKSMCELIIITLLAGGLMNTIRQGGGFDVLTHAITRHINGKRGAESAIAGLTAITNVCTANNTIAILTVAPIAHELSVRFGVAPRKAASLMDTASCFVQGVLPYGAQLLMASGLAKVSPIEIIPHLYYPMGIGAMVIISIIFQFPKCKSTKQ
ncbi:MAG: Na+/H+ antiporter NhaC family protein [Alistipes sp.]|nr:Na+/H+ antiporter NhaC family protein [Alistipes sp.]